MEGVGRDDCAAVDASAARAQHQRSTSLRRSGSACRSQRKDEGTRLPRDDSEGAGLVTGLGQGWGSAAISCGTRLEVTVRTGRQSRGLGCCGPGTCSGRR